MRFLDFSESVYSKHRFEDIFNFSTGKNIKQREASPEFETPCVRYGELYHMYKEVIHEVINRTNLNKNDLLFSKGDEILLPSAGEDPLDIGSASALTIPNVAIGRTINILRPKIESLYSQIFVSYYINQKLKKKISSLAKGVSISNVYNSDLKKLSITLPSLPEQNRIAEFLSLLAERIQTQSKIIENLKSLMLALRQEIFSQQIRFKNDTRNNFPDWEKKSLEEICEKESSIVSANSLGETTGDYKIYGATGYLQNVSFYQEEKPYISIVKDGAGVGRTLLCEAKSSVLGTLDKIKPKKNSDLYFLYSLLDTIRFDKYITGSTIPHIYFKDYSKEKIKQPCLAEQTKIANFLSSIDKKIETEKQILTQYQQQKKYLLQSLFI